MGITAGKFQKIYDPSVGEEYPWYINDHCFVQGGDGIWHMFGITHEEPPNSFDVKFLAHATSPRLDARPWKKEPHVLHADYERWRETHVWAPHVVKHAGLFHMFYCAGGDDFACYKIHLAVSKDLWEWERHPENPMVVDGFAARDPMVIGHEDGWIMYYTATGEPAGGNHVVAAVTSRDLVYWGDKRVVFVHHVSGTHGGPTESPFVVLKDDKYYLFVCTNTPYNNTAVYESDSPFHWDMADQVGDLPAHAAEVIHTPPDMWHISRCGWGQQGLYLAELTWDD